MFLGQENVEPKQTEALKTFHFTVHDDAYRETGVPTLREVKAHVVYFYESGHVGFWINGPGEDRTLVLAIRAQEVWEP